MLNKNKNDSVSEGHNCIFVPMFSLTLMNYDNSALDDIYLKSFYYIYFPQTKV